MVHWCYDMSFAPSLSLYALVSCLLCLHIVVLFSGKASLHWSLTTRWMPSHNFSTHDFWILDFFFFVAPHWIRLYFTVSVSSYFTYTKCHKQIGVCTHVEKYTHVCMCIAILLNKKTNWYYKRLVLHDSDKRKLFWNQV